MIKRHKIIVVFFLINLICLTNIAYAKYMYQFEEVIIEFSRDDEPPKCEVSYSEEDLTNQNVIVTITANKEVEQVSGFVLSDDRKILTKEVTENIKEIIQVRDLSGNYTEVEYEVNNIDKEPPKIIGIENEAKYKAPLSLEYSDNTEIKEISINQYSTHLKISSNSIFYDNDTYCGVDRSATTLTVNVYEHPLNTKKYRYYLNDQLYTTTDKESYTFTGLEKGEVYDIKVEAIDKNGTILDEKQIENTTSYYSFITSKKTTNGFIANMSGLSDNIASVSYSVKNLNHPDKIIKFANSEINSEKSCQILLESFSGFNSQIYEIDVIMYDINNTEIAHQEFMIDLNTNYDKSSNIIDKYELTKSGNYQIIVKDFANNETFYYIKVE